MKRASCARANGKQDPAGLAVSGQGRRIVGKAATAAAAVMLAMTCWTPLAEAKKNKPCPGCNKKGQPAAEDAVQAAGYDPLSSLGISPTVPALSGGAQDTTLRVGAENTTLQLGTENTTLQVGTQQTLLQAGVERQGGPVNILFLIDASQSMKDKIGFGSSEQKMDAAKRVLQETIATVPADINIGLRVFGNGFRNDPFSDCQQSTLLVPVGKNNRRAIIGQVRELRPFGLTPLTYGLMQAEQDLRYINGPKTVILISDGAETCGGDPCAYIERLSRLGIKMKVDIVGLGLKRDREARDQLGCIAEKSGGKFYDANTSAELVNSISNSVRQALSGKIITRMKANPAEILGPQSEPEKMPPLAPRPATNQPFPLDDLPADLRR